MKFIEGKVYYFKEITGQNIKGSPYEDEYYIYLGSKKDTFCGYTSTILKFAEYNMEDGSYDEDEIVTCPIECMTEYKIIPIP